MFSFPGSFNLPGSPNKQHSQNQLQLSVPDVSSEKLYKANCSSIPAARSNAGTKEEEAGITHSALQEEMHRMSDLPTQPTNTVARAMLPENKDSAYKACFRKRAGSICHRLTTVSTLYKQGFWDSQTVHRASKVASFSNDFCTSVTPKRLSKEEKCFLHKFQQNTHYCALQRTLLLKFTLLKSPQTSKALIFPRYISCAPHWRTARLSRTTNTCHFFCPFFPCHPIPCTPLRLRIQRGTRALKQHLSWSKAEGRWIKQGIVWEEKEGRAIQWVRCLMDPCDVSVAEAHRTEAQQLSFKPQSNPGEYRASQCHHKATPLPDLSESSLLFSVVLSCKPSPRAGTSQTPASWPRWRILFSDISASRPAL